MDHDTEIVEDNNDKQEQVEKEDQSLNNNIPDVNFSPICRQNSPAHREEERGIDLSICVISFVKPSPQSVRNLCQFDFFTKSLTISFVLSRECCECSKIEGTFWFFVAKMSNFKVFYL